MMQTRDSSLKRDLEISEDHPAENAIAETGWEVLQLEHAFHLIQAGAVLALHEAAKSYLIQLMEDTNLCMIHANQVTI